MRKTSHCVLCRHCRTFVSVGRKRGSVLKARCFRDLWLTPKGRPGSSHMCAVADRSVRGGCSEYDDMCDEGTNHWAALAEMRRTLPLGIVRVGEDWSALPQQPKRRTQRGRVAA